MMVLSSHTAVDDFVLCPDFPLPLFVGSVVFRVRLSQTTSPFILSLPVLVFLSSIPVSDGPSLWGCGRSVVFNTQGSTRKKEAGKQSNQDAYVCAGTRNAITGKLGGL